MKLTKCYTCGQTKETVKVNGRELCSTCFTDWDRARIQANLILLNERASAGQLHTPKSRISKQGDGQ